MPATKFGPEVKAGRRASYWEWYLRHLVATLLIFDERRRADRIITAYLNKPNLAWLQLYAYICAKTGCLYSAKLPGATALKALIDGHDNPDTANAGVSKILKRYNNKGDAELTCQQLCDVATSTKSYVTLDWPLRQKTGKQIRTFQSYMHDNGWDNNPTCSYQRPDQHAQRWRPMEATGRELLGPHLDVAVRLRLHKVSSGRSAATTR